MNSKNDGESEGLPRFGDKADASGNLKAGRGEQKKLKSVDAHGVNKGMSAKLGFTMPELRLLPLLPLLISTVGTKDDSSLLDLTSDEVLFSRDIPVSFWTRGMNSRGWMWMILGEWV